MVPSGLLGVLVAIALTGYVQGNYFVVSPNKFRPEKPFEVEVSYTGTEANPSVEVSLGVKDSNPLDSKTESLTNGYKSIKLTIPAEVPEGTYMLSVIGRSGTREIFKNSTVVNTDQENSLLLVQTDKPLYKPMETVRFRVVCVGMDLKPRNMPTDISIFDQNDNKLEEWLAVDSPSGVIEKSYKLSDFPSLGTWRIQVRNKVAMNTKEFSVEKYVLPKFDVKVETTPKLIINDVTQDLEVKVTTKYTYGKAVQGKVKLIFSGGSQGVKTIENTLQGNEDGTHTEMIRVADLRNYKSYNGIQLSVNVTEDATMVTQSSDQITIPWYAEKIKMEFLPTSSRLYRPGLSVDLQLKVTDLSTGGPALVKSTVEMDVYFDKQVKQSLEIDNDGMVTASFEVPSDYTNMYDLNFNAKLTKPGGKGYYYAYWNVKKYRAKLNTMLTVDIPTIQPIQAGQDFSIEIQSTAPLQQAAYMVLSRGQVADSGMIAMAGTSKTHVIMANRMMAPGAKVFVYGIVTDGKETEVIADSVDVKVNGVFDNEVALSFSKTEVRPGGLVDVTVNSAPDSKYYILAVDESVLLLGTGNDITQSEIKTSIKGFNLGETPSYNDGPEEHGRLMGDVFMPPGGGSNEEPSSAGEILKTRGLVYLSGIYVEKARPKEDLVIMEAMADGGGPVMNKGAEADMGGPAPPPASGAKTEFAAVGRVRKSFPEAWMWQDGMVSSTGSVTFSETVPDTITDWVATAFAISSEKGLAVTQTSSQLRAFQPFFVSLALPYAIKRGEIFQLRVSISNYLTTTTPVMVTLKRSEDFGIIEKDSSGKEVVMYKEVVTTVQVQPNIPAGVMFKISARKLGYVQLNVVAAPDSSTGQPADSLMRDVLVKPEGLMQHRVIGETIELSQEKPLFEKTIYLKNTNEYVEGSRRTEMKVTGDIMGPTVEGLGNLVQMPTGCGEQNMITLVPNIVVYIYLKTVNRLTNDIKEKALTFMKTGYQRELQYLRNDNSFSAFGNSDESGSTWLTAFVMKSFSQARKQITVDQKMMQNAFAWLIEKQDKTGMFKEVGRVIHQEMLGGASEGKALTAFIYIALKQSESFLSVTQVKSLATTQTYLEGLVTGNKLEKPYEMAIVAYALTLAESSYADQLLTKLEGKPKPWEKTTPEPQPMPADGPALFDYRRPKPTSSDIETWSYVLLSYAEKQDLSGGRPIMKWLLSEQNGFGGFHSTQDTVLGLQALADYAALAYKAPRTDISLFVKANAPSGAVSHTFLIQKEKLLLLQSHIFPADTTSIELYANGTGLAIVKTLWQYNTMKEPQIISDKKITGSVTTNKINDQLFNVKSCFKSDDSNLGMTLMNLELQTGMSVTNMEQLESDNNIQRVENNPGNIVLYYNEPSTDYQCANVRVEKSQANPIANMQAASMQAFVYYQPDVRQEVLYTVEEAPIVDICSICGKFCPKKCDTSSATVWKLDGMLLAACTCLLFSLIVAV